MTDAEILAIGKILIFHMNNVPLIILNSNFTQNWNFFRRIGEYTIIFLLFFVISQLSKEIRQYIDCLHDSDSFLIFCLSFCPSGYDKWKWGNISPRRLMVETAVMGEYFHIYRSFWRYVRFILSQSGMTLCCDVLYCTVLYFTVLYFTVLYIRYILIQCITIQEHFSIYQIKSLCGGMKCVCRNRSPLGFFPFSLLLQIILISHIFEYIFCRSHMCAVDGKANYLVCPTSCDSDVAFEDCTCKVNALVTGMYIL